MAEKIKPIEPAKEPEIQAAVTTPAEQALVQEIPAPPEPGPGGFKNPAYLAWLREYYPGKYHGKYNATNLSIYLPR